jgi:hypothetical protein
MGKDFPPEGKGSFWSSLPGILTASATALGAITALITTLYTAGIVGQPKPDTTSMPPPTQVSPSTQAAVEGSAQKIHEARQQEQAATETQRKAEAEMERLRRELAATKAKEAEARKQAELEAAKRRAKEAERARLAAEAELERLKGTRAGITGNRENSLSSRETAPSQDPLGLQDAILAFRVVRVWQNEVTIDVDYSVDRSRSGPLIAGATLLFQGKAISGYKLSPVTQPRGTARVQLVVRTQLGRQSDQLEVFLRADRDRVVVRRFPFSRTFEDGTPSGNSSSDAKRIIDQMGR